MTIQTNTSDRKALAKQISELLRGAPIRYAGAPTFAYQIGDAVTIDRQSDIEVTNEETLTALKPFLAQNGWMEPDAANEDAVREPKTSTVEVIPEQPAEHVGESEIRNPEVMTISTPVENITVAELKNLAYQLYSKQYLLNRATGQETLRIPELLVNRLKEYTPEKPEEFTSLLDDCRALNELAGFDFRDGEVTLCFPFDENQPEQWTAYAELTRRIVDAARSATRVMPTLLKPENEKYYMRGWLLRLGYGGADFKAQRRMLLNNLKGYAAFKDAADMEQHRAKYAALRRASRELDAAPAPATADAQKGGELDE